MYASCVPRPQAATTWLDPTNLIGIVRRFVMETQWRFVLTCLTSERRCSVYVREGLASGRWLVDLYGSSIAVTHTKAGAQETSIALLVQSLDPTEARVRKISYGARYSLD